MVVCKQWRDIAKDDYLWKCACANRWNKRKLYKTFYKRKNQQSLLPPRLLPLMFWNSSSTFGNVSVSVLMGRKDTNKVACIISKSLFDYTDRTSFRALAFDFLNFSPQHPFIPSIRAWISLLFKLIE
ncbi:hypothetical protein K2173_019782 [Erythroxylum novogranatense]|uniref:F-box domain-containing protein n=1 Tax=Erythroxylum novogranatense TaxID=1862640 RepID=A0AAV8SMW6_9ROSI|nr:hypothetical protein K2173_019782 [Erythroxylum novogranatense]